VAIELDVPLAGLRPGPYICQLNVIDDAAEACVSALCGAGARSVTAGQPRAVGVSRLGHGIAGRGRIGSGEAVGAVTAAGAAAGAALEVIAR